MANENMNDLARRELNDEAEEDIGAQNVPRICSNRWQLAYLAFLGIFWINAHRANLSMAIVCMVKQEYLSNATLGAVNDNTTSDSNMTNMNVSFLFSAVENNSASWDLMENTSIANESNYNIQQEMDREKHQDGCHMAFETIVEEYRGAEFEWGKTIQGGLLSCYFYGYTVALFIGGYLANRFGGKSIALVAIFVSCLSIVLVPLCARTNVYIVYVLRVITGLAGGTFMSSAYSLISVWAPPQERSRLTAVAMLGSMVGIMATMSSSGFLCAYGFDNGWGSIFYIHGLSPLPFLLLWHQCVYNAPEHHPRISQEERTYLSQSRRIAPRVGQTPWREILTSKPFHAVLVAQFLYNWTFFSIITLIPTYMKEVLKFDMKQNGGFSSVPFITMALSVYTTGHLADIIRNNNWCGLTALRRILQTISFSGSGVCLVLIGFVTCDTRHYAVVLLCLCTVFEGLASGGLVVIYMDFCGVYAGTVYGICNSIATTAGMVVPIVAGIMTKMSTQEEWRNFFYLTAALNILGAVLFATSARATPATWAQEANDETVAMSPLENTRTNGVVD